MPRWEDGRPLCEREVGGQDEAASFVAALGPELRSLGCTDKLLAVVVADPARYHVVEEDQIAAGGRRRAPRRHAGSA